jgi:hypothetical protein
VNAALSFYGEMAGQRTPPVSPLKNAAGRLVGAAKMVRDLTEQKRDEEALYVWHAGLHAATVAESIQGRQIRAARANRVAETAFRPQSWRVSLAA